MTERRDGGTNRGTICANLQLYRAICLLDKSEVIRKKAQPGFAAKLLESVKLTVCDNIHATIICGIVFHIFESNNELNDGIKLEDQQKTNLQFAEFALNEAKITAGYIHFPKTNVGLVNIYTFVAFQKDFRRVPIEEVLKFSHYFRIIYCYTGPNFQDSILMFEGGGLLFIIIKKRRI